MNNAHCIDEILILTPIFYIVIINPFEFFNGFQLMKQYN